MFYNKLFTPSFPLLIIKQSNLSRRRKGRQKGNDALSLFTYTLPSKTHRAEKRALKHRKLQTFCPGLCRQGIKVLFRHARSHLQLLVFTISPFRSHILLFIITLLFPSFFWCPKHQQIQFIFPCGFFLLLAIGWSLIDGTLRVSMVLGCFFTQHFVSIRETLWPKQLWSRKNVQ